MCKALLTPMGGLSLPEEWMGAIERRWGEKGVGRGGEERGGKQWLVSKINYKNLIYKKERKNKKRKKMSPHLRLISA